MKAILSTLRRRVMLMIGRAVIRAVASDGGRITLDLTALDGEPLTGVELAEPSGFTSVPLPGAEALVLSIMGERGNAVAVSLGDRRHRPRDLVPGEAALFDDLQQRIVIRRDGIEIHAPLGLRAVTPSFTVNGDAVATVTDLVNVGSGSSAGRWPIVTGVGDDG